MSPWKRQCLKHETKVSDRIWFVTSICIFFTLYSKHNFRKMYSVNPFPVFLPSVPGPINHLRNLQAHLISLPHLHLHHHSPPGHFSSPCPFHQECLILIVYTLQLTLIITFSRFPAPILDSSSPNPHGRGRDLSKMWISQVLPSSLLRKKDPVLSHTLLPLLSLRSPPPTNEPQPLCLISPHFPSPSSGSSNTVSCCLWLPLHPDVGEFPPTREILCIGIS